MGPGNYLSGSGPGGQPRPTVGAEVLRSGFSPDRFWTSSATFRDRHQGWSLAPAFRLSPEPREIPALCCGRFVKSEGGRFGPVRPRRIERLCLRASTLRLGQMPIEKRPNIFVVLFDCLRGSDFPGGRDPVPGMPFAESLRRESVTYPRAVSPAPWTIPSHASLFTGLYPFESGVHAYRSLKVPPGVSRLPERLRRGGYRSLSLSANPFVSPRFGLVQGFDHAAWGGWWEAFLRTPRSRAPNFGDGSATSSGETSDRTMEWVRDGPLGDLLRTTSTHSYRFPYVLDAGSRFLNQVRFPGVPRSISQTPWIETELREWLTRQPREVPVFGFMNVTDTHEPYYPDPGAVRGFREWWRLARVRQDHAMAVSGEWTPSPRECSVLRELYRQSIRHLDTRLRDIVSVIRESGRWENSIFIVTSDHGQSLGEHGMMFHLLRLDEPLVRIPLWVRFPSAWSGGTVARGWASLIDLTPTLVEQAGLVAPNLPSACALTKLIDGDRPAPALTMADGIVWPVIRRRFTATREKVWDRPMVAAYDGSIKVLSVGQGPEIHAYNVDDDPGESRDLWPSADRRVETLRSQCLEVSAQMAMSAPGASESATEERLRSWGYI